MQLKTFTLITLLLLLGLTIELKGFKMEELGRILKLNFVYFDIVVFSSFIKENWLLEEEISYISANETRSFFDVLKERLNSYGHLVIFLSLQNPTDLNPLLQQIGDFQDLKSLWNPCFLIEYSIAKLDEESLDKLLLELRENTLITFPLNSDVYLIVRSIANPSQWELIELYSLKNKQFAQKIKSVEGQVNILEKPSRRSNLNGVTITAVSMDVDGYELATDFENGTDSLSGGFEVHQFWYLRDALNFTEKATRGIGFVREGPGMTLTGMAIQINKQEADICISSTEFLEYRASGPDGFSYLHPNFHIGMLAFFKQPPASSIRDVFTSAFSLNLWAFLLGLWIIICFSMHIAYRIYKARKMELTCWKDSEMKEEITIWAAGAICQQGWHFTPENMAPRIIFFFGWLAGFMCYIAFSAQLVSILSIEVVPIHSFSDLLREKFFIFNDGHIPTTKYYVKGLQERGDIPEIAENLRNVDIEETIDKLIKTPTTMITVSDSFYPILQKAGYSEQLICQKLSHVKIETSPVKMSMYVKRANPLRTIFNYWILVMTERGVKHRLMRDYLIETSVQCLRDSNGFNNPLGSKDIFTAYAILICGFILGFSLSFLEQLHHKIWFRRLDSLPTQESQEFSKNNPFNVFWIKKPSSTDLHIESPQK